MTREEAINKLNWALDNNTIEDVQSAYDYIIALKMAIKALEQEPTTKNNLGVDCVARQDVERYIEGFINEYTPREELEFINLELDGLKHIPSVTPQEPKWIPITEGLPASYKKVLITNGTVTCIGWVSPTDRCWRADSESEYDIFYDTVAWMPLPKSLGDFIIFWIE